MGRVVVAIAVYNPVASLTAPPQLALEYTERFSAAFTAKAKAKARQDRIHDGPGAPYAHRELFVAPPNEYGLPKLVPTTVRPTLLPHSELYDAPALATFVANRIAYEPLADPLLPPSTLPSPTATLEWGTGDAFDLSSLLAGYLLGAGYDAYVVWGRAPRWVAARELGERPHPALRDSIERAAAEADAAAAASEPPPGDEPGLPSAEEAALAEALGQLGIVLPKYEAKARGIEPSRYEAKLAEIAAAESSANILRGAAADSKTSGVSLRARRAGPRLCPPPPAHTSYPSDRPPPTRRSPKPPPPRPTRRRTSLAFSGAGRTAGCWCAAGSATTARASSSSRPRARGAP